MTNTNFRQTVADVLFLHFEVPSILFAPAHLVALFTLGISTGLVLDCGYSEALVLPVYEGFTLLSTWHSGRLGSHHIQKELEVQIRNHAFLEEIDGRKKFSDVVETDDITDSVLEDILVRSCFISPAERAAQWQKILDEETKNGSSLTQPPSYATESFICPFGVGGPSGVSKLVHIPSRLRETATEILFTPQDADGVTITSLFLDCLLMCPIDCRR